MSGCIQDEKAHKAVGSFKGASGWKCCAKCQNVVNTIEDISTNPRYVDYKTASLDECIQHTDESMFAMADDLESKHGNIAPQNFVDLEKAYGVKYEPFGVLYNRRLRTFVKLHSMLIYDWMHNLLTSSGVGQYQCNGFTRCALAHGKSLKELDDFAQTIVLPPSSSKIRNTFFRDRYTKKEGGSLKGFAGECAIAVQVLSWYARTVLEPEGIMVEECVCMHLLEKIIELYSMQDSALHYHADLTLTVNQHHKLFVALHPGLCKKKGHYGLHTPDDIWKFQRLLSCFAPERFHKLVKARAASCFKGGGCMEFAITKTIISQMLSMVVASPYGQAYIAVKPRPVPEMNYLAMELCALPTLYVSKPLDHTTCMFLLCTYSSLFESTNRFVLKLFVTIMPAGPGVL